MGLLCVSSQNHNKEVPSKKEGTPVCGSDCPSDSLFFGRSPLLVLIVVVSTCVMNNNVER